MDFDASRCLQGLRLGQGGLILSGNAGVAYQGHENGPFAISGTVNKRPFVNECNQAFSRRAGPQSLGFLALCAN